MGDVTVAEAATELGVSQRHITRLAQSGELEVVRKVGGALLIDSASVHRWAQMRRRQGRPWSEPVAWGALALLSGHTADWLTASQRTRLKHRLRRSTAEDVAFFARRRAVPLHARAWDATDHRIGHRIVNTGVGALDTMDAATAARFGLTTHGTTRTEGYVTITELDAVIDDLGLTEDREGDLTLRVVSEDNPLFQGTPDAPTPPLAAIAVDLMDSLDTREHSAGTKVLQELIDDLR
ncbi:helix-turn-helix domain-containing protein [Rhodococcus pyridinivorans]|uniref:helix-turn-helix domain-containing protein n=1 Tax=Rhodococcus pyridinivorans TaxID=103816 RepID=UPI00228371C1|nr:helix-turn-helix domain-containing protein [Rhodococcus pyridinivorans]WAL49293.1 helix-turn-helix domain-containing protein [Rhodococcus pyridinivorans]